ncbi:MAG TPA: TIGR03435 family protein [Acidobacteriaceae bacterium]|nr:TIGR03435 family protein [Acidobacteriaceae bacterium]
MRLAGATAAVLCLTGGSAMRAQDGGQQVAKPQAMARDADPDWDVVTVKPSDPDSKEVGYRISGRRQIQLLRQTAEAMLIVGYGVHKKQIENAPDWVRTQEWDVKGETDLVGEPNAQQTRSLVRKLLQERFGLVLHTEQQEMPVYGLTLAKGGMKLKASDGDPKALANEYEHQSGGEAMLKFQNAPLSLLITMLDFRADKPVVDKTGLTGRYDFALRYTTDETRVSPDANAAPGLFTAMEEQLGLKLEPVKAMADVLVVDRIERPTAN